MQNRDVQTGLGASRDRRSEAVGASSARFLGLDHGADTVNHILDEVFLGAAETSLVGDIVGAVVSLGVLTVDASDLDVVLVGNSLELVLLLAELGQLDVHRGAHGSAKICGAGGDVAESRVVSELADGLDVGSGSAEAVKDLGDARALLHRDNSQLILLVDPDEESLGIIVEDSTAAGPVAVQVASSQETVSLPKIY